MDLRRGEAINREDTQWKKMMKAEKKRKSKAKHQLVHERLPQKHPPHHNHEPRAQIVQGKLAVLEVWVVYCKE